MINIFNIQWNTALIGIFQFRKTCTYESIESKNNNLYFSIMLVDYTSITIVSLLFNTMLVW